MNINIEYNVHHNRAIIKLLFDYNEALIAKVKQLPNARWSQTMHCWYIPETPQVLEILAQADIQVAPVAKKIAEPSSKNIAPQPILPEEKKQHSNEPLLIRFSGYMKEKRYSPRTIEAYTECLRIFFNYHCHKNILDITNGDVYDFNQQYILAKKLSATYQTQFVKAIKLFYEKIPRKSIHLEDIERPRQSRALPRVLSKQDVGKIITGTANLKHKAMLSMIYACGLRRSELLNMRIVDVDSKRNVVNILRAKGDRDRIVPLSEKILLLLREYFKQYHPVTWLFEGEKPNTPYTEGSLQKVLMSAKERSGITARFTLHSLRHCYATHLLEAGTDLRYIQELLGHKHSKTTEIYTHVSTKSIQKIKSPFDDLDL